jgi:hypothetical protein
MLQSESETKLGTGTTRTSRNWIDIPHEYLDRGTVYEISYSNHILWWRDQGGVAMIALCVKGLRLLDVCLSSSFWVTDVEVTP